MDPSSTLQARSSLWTCISLNHTTCTLHSWRERCKLLLSADVMVLPADVMVLPADVMVQVIEQKGLDIVRRDWSILAKQMGSYCLSKTLSGGYACAGPCQPVRTFVLLLVLLPPLVASCCLHPSTVSFRASTALAMNEQPNGSFPLSRLVGSSFMLSFRAGSLGP